MIGREVYKHLAPLEPEHRWLRGHHLTTAVTAMTPPNAHHYTPNYRRSARPGAGPRPDGDRPRL